MKTRDGEALAGRASASVDFAGIGASPVTPAVPAYQPPIPGAAAAPATPTYSINPITGLPM